MKIKFPNYSFEETLLVLDLYLKNRDDSILQQRDKRVIRLSEILREIYIKNYPLRKISKSHRSPNSIVYKLSMFKAFDEKRDTSYNKLGKEIWKKYNLKPLAYIDNEAKIIIDKYFSNYIQLEMQL